MKSRFLGLLAVALVAGPIAANASTIYSINIDGNTIDLVGSVEVDVLGTFTATQFEYIVVGFSILASNNGAAPYLFTKETAHGVLRMALTSQLTRSRALYK